MKASTAPQPKSPLSALKIEPPAKPEDDRPKITAASLTKCILSSAELATLEIPKRPRLLDEWLCQGDLGYIYAPRGVGKTWLSMALPLAVSGGNPLGEWKAGEHRANVLYVDGEMPLELTRDRCRGLAANGEDISFLHHDHLFQSLATSINIAHLGAQEAITGALVDGGFTFLVLDNLSCLASGMDENAGIDHEEISNWLLDLRRRGITTLLGRPQQ